jgi:nucleoside-diphosphate-sugar epimerase
MGSAYVGIPALVLGASGFIGAWTVRALHAAGADVTAVIRDRARAGRALGELASHVRLAVADLTSPATIDQLLDSAAVVFNLAGYGVDRRERDPDCQHALNTELAAHVAARLAEREHGGWQGLQLVHAGSALEYGRLEGVLSESRAPQPTTDYGRAKLQGTRAVEARCAASGLRAVVARLFTVYGPGEHSDRLLPALLRAAQSGGPLDLTSGRQARNFTYVEDVADGLLRLGVSAALPGTVVNLAGPRLHTVREFAETAAAVLGMKPAQLRFGALPDREDEMWHGDVDVARLRALTSWIPATSIADGIRRTREMSHGG